MRSFTPFLFITAFALTAEYTLAQTKIIHGDGTRILKKMDEDAFMLKEIGAVFLLDDGAFKVVSVMPAEQRPASYKDVDLQQDDVILMANGKRVTKPKELQTIYDSLKVGEILKIGLKRKDEMRLVSLKKADPKDLPQLQMKILQGGGDDNVGTFPAVGVVMKMKGKDLVIVELLPGETAIRNLDVKVGDVLEEINGKRCTSLQEYGDAYDAIVVGENVQ
jgi:C-terminal processing protease CtpA/Prc